MSTDAITWVWNNSKARLGTRLVLLALADYANDDWNSYPGVKKLGEKSRLSVRQVQRCIQELIELGEITVALNASEYKTNIYQIVTPDKLSPPTSTTVNVQEMSPKPSSKPSVDSKESSIRRRNTRITDAFVDRMVQDYAKTLGGEDSVKDHIQNAVNHVSHAKSSDKQKHVMTWLRRQVEGGLNRGPGYKAPHAGLESEVRQSASSIKSTISVDDFLARHRSRG